MTYQYVNNEGEMQFVNAYIHPLVQDNPQAWKFVYTDEKGLVRIYERVRSEDRDKGEQ